MKTLIKNIDKYGRCVSEVVEHAYGEMKLSTLKFKIVSEVGNSYSHLKIYILNSKGLSEVANEYDVPEYEHVDYVLSDEVKKKTIAV